MKFEYFNKPLTGAILTIILSLVGFGLLIMLSASLGLGAMSAEYEYSSLHFFVRQLLFMIVGLILMFVIYKGPDISELRSKFTWPLIIVTGILLVWALCSPSVNGVRRWISVGGFRFQPGELAKLTIVLLWAWYLVNKRKKIMEVSRTQAASVKSKNGSQEKKSWLSIFSKDWLKAQWRGAFESIKVLWPAMFITVLILTLIEIGKDLGTVIVIVATMAIMIFVAGTALELMTMAVLGGCVGVVALLLKESYRVSRIASWLDPFAYQEDGGYQAVNSFIAIGSGGFWGVGIPFSRQKFDFLPEMHCDFIYAIVCEELGFAGAFGLLLLFVCLICCCLRIASDCKDPYKSMVAFGIAVQVTGQALFNIGVVTGLLPNKGLPLPFVSAGGSSLIVTLISMGILLNISRYVETNPKQDIIPPKKRKIPREGATISSSDQQVCVTPVNSNEWEAIVAVSRVKSEAKLPRPAIKASWSSAVEASANNDNSEDDPKENMEQKPLA